MHPAELQKILGRMSLEELATMFGERKAAILLKVLQEIKGTEPELSGAGTKATFTLKQEGDGRDSITF